MELEYNPKAGDRREIIVADRVDTTARDKERLTRQLRSLQRKKNPTAAERRLATRLGSVLDANRAGDA